MATARSGSVPERLAHPWFLHPSYTHKRKFMGLGGAAFGGELLVLPEMIW